ncbi:patatin-like phospholipase family protein [Agarivorans sp. 1_MG-2023]|uniref:patatin-like phospholipase family protein n=1 Tax=Agarivorans sp. 1_MG-2023 TaxID=3062634 RepID=UPI0026E42BAE|nr:patatin-like phospholipase family protein [Agarivorans sp. 1_MG-2023]MDO6762141.1 patatin-like phospholipase family protein [Agarivorans sp. 1_MG-2023]
MKKLSLVLFCCLVISACSSSHGLDQRVQQSNYEQAVFGVAGVNTSNEPFRFWGGEAPNFLYNQETNSSPLQPSPQGLNILVLSGGGSNGAYGAGVLNGLRDAGALPEFSIITGVSAGALIAPFVYVGGDELTTMKTVMLDLNDKAILGNRNFLNTLFKDAFSNGEGLYGFIAATFDDAMIAKMALAQQGGKRLFIGTTHFDSGRQVIWNVGAIANSELPNKQALIHQILTASSSIPGVFPPQFIKVDMAGEMREELHVDGGLSAQMFMDPSAYDYSQISQSLGIEQSPQVFVVRNGALKMPYKPLKDKGVELIGRSVQSLTVAQSRGDLYRMFYFSEKNGFNLRFSFVDSDFNAPKNKKLMFDQAYMQALFDYGYQKATQQQLWQSELQ